MKHVLPMKPVSKWMVFGVASIVLALAILLVEIVSSFFLANPQMAHLSVVSGVVKVSDGITEVTAVSGNLNIRNTRTLLKTGEGMANLTFWEGSVVIVDSNSTIEINRQIETDYWNSFAFNLVEGKALVVNGDSSQAPTQIIIGGAITVQVFRGAVGLEVIPGVEDRKSVDCLVGHCLVNGVYQLNTGQNAQIGTDSIPQISESVPYAQWTALMIANETTSVLSTLTAILPTASPDDPNLIVLIPTSSQLTSPSGFILTPTPKETPASTYPQGASASPAWTAIYTITVASPTATQTPSRIPIGWYTITPSQTLTPSASQLPNITITPQPTPMPTITFMPQPTPNPSSTFIPQPTPIPTATDTPQPTPMPTATDTPQPTPMPTASDTPQPTPMPTSTDTPQPTPTPAFTKTPQPTRTRVDTHTPKPKPTQTPTIEPSPTHKPRPR